MRRRQISINMMASAIARRLGGRRRSVRRPISTAAIASAVVRRLQRGRKSLPDSVASAVIRRLSRGGAQPRSVNKLASAVALRLQRR